MIGHLVSGGSLEIRTTRVEILNSIAHDVQGDGIVLFVVRDGTIRNSTAWPTGMQHSYTIGTPNAIWTWRCDRCSVERSEPFLTDSPGIDGGPFDIDFGNSKNRVIDNFGHHTQGYCVSVFGTFEETSDSEVARNTYLQNGLSPRFAERQGAILFMTWSKGTIRGVNVHDNTIIWNPAGSTPAVQLGEEADINGLKLTRNTIYSSSPLFANSRYTPMRGISSTLQAVRSSLHLFGRTRGNRSIHLSHTAEEIIVPMGCLNLVPGQETLDP